MTQKERLEIEPPPSDGEGLKDEERFYYQTLHLYTGDIFSPDLQLKSLANSSLFIRGPRLRNLQGECGLVRIWFLMLSAVYLAQLES